MIESVYAVVVVVKQAMIALFFLAMIIAVVKYTFERKNTKGIGPK